MCNIYVPLTGKFLWNFMKAVWNQRVIHGIEDENWNFNLKQTWKELLMICWQDVYIYAVVLKLNTGH